MTEIIKQEVRAIKNVCEVQCQSREVLGVRGPDASRRPTEPRTQMGPEPPQLAPPTGLEVGCENRRCTTEAT